MCQRVLPLSLQRRAEHKLTKAPASAEPQEDEEDAFYYLTFQMCLTDTVYILNKASSWHQGEADVGVWKDSSRVLWARCSRSVWRVNHVSEVFSNNRRMVGLLEAHGGWEETRDHN